MQKQTFKNFLIEAKLKGVVDINAVFNEEETNVFFTLLVDFGHISYEAPGFKEETISIGKLLPTQEQIDGTNTENDDPLLVVERGGRFYIIDGHHRLGKYRRLKEKEIDCMILHFPTEHVDLEWFEKQLGMKLQQSNDGIVRPR